MEASDGTRYLNDDGTAFSLGLLSVPDRCVSCINQAA